jgi:hypothetical protein
MTPKKLTLVIAVCAVIIVGGILAWPKSDLPSDVYYNQSQGYYQKKGESLPYDPVTHQSGPYSLQFAREEAQKYRK